MLTPTFPAKEEMKSMFKVARKQSFTDNLYLLEIEIAEIAEKAQPGHHVDIRLNPDAPVITTPIARADRDAGTITVVELARDLPSEQLMMLREGDEIFQVRGPLGTACRIDDVDKVALAAEDLGVASLLWRALAYKETGAYTICVVGFPSDEEVFWQNEFSETCDELYVSTLDGSYGVSGKITGPIQAICDTHKDLERLIVIGSLKNMKRAAKVASDHGITTRVSFDAVRPAVGRPSIFDIRDDSQDAFQFARAPELDAGTVDFDKLIAREKALQASET
jgi:ferredoxin--NADP+ reductase